MKNITKILITLILAFVISIPAIAVEKKAPGIKPAPVADKGPDLVVKEIKCGPGNKLQFTIENIGEGSLPSGWKAVADVFFDGRRMGHVDLGRPTSGDITPAHGTASYLVAFDILRTVNVRVVVDATNSIKESNEGNNTKEARVEPCERAALPDLYIVHFRYDGRDVNFANFPPDRPITVSQGDSKAVEVTIGNWAGTADVRVGDISVGIYLSTERAGGCRPTSIMLWGTVVSTGLRAGETRSFSTTITIPTTLASGNYWMYPMVDAPNRIAERNEEANCFTSVPLRVVGR